MYTTADRYQPSRRLMAEHRKQALEEVNQIETSEKQHQQHNQHNHVTPRFPAYRKVSATQSTAPPPCHTNSPVVPAIAKPQRPDSTLKRLFKRMPKKKDHSTSISPPIGSERILLSGQRTADPSAGGQMPAEDSWDWYDRNILAPPQVPRQCHAGAAAAKSCCNHAPHFQGGKGPGLER
ncbi:hypothetical protein PMIN06_003113 [Paraphaeosphaeria minitans]